MQVLIGSTALKKLYPDFYREPKDIDILTDEKIEKAKGVDSYQVKTFELSGYFIGKMPTIDQLYTIKVSHIFWDKGFDKHISDIRFLKEKGAKLIPELYQALYKEWEHLYGKKKAKLNVSAEDFFQSTVKRIYEHDSIHQSVAYYDKPLFNKILIGEVQVSKDKFEAMPYTEKLQLVREEVYATALERLIIPSEYTFNARRAYWWALMKTITSFSKGWFPLFVVENITELWKPDINYVKKHKDNYEMLIPLEAN